LESVKASDAASYTVVISNAVGSVTSSAAMVTAAPDLRDSDGDGLTNYDEVFVYGTNPHSADTDGDGLSDSYELGLGRYSVVLGSFTWQQAEADAKTKGGTLATFASQGEWLWAQESIGADALYDVTGLWIGATDSAVEGTWLWITGEPVTYSHWAVGEPNNGNNSDYAAIAGDLGGETGDWYDYRATTQRDGYILETGYATDPTVADADHDGLSDGEEQVAGIHPFLADTDGDGANDGAETEWGSDPRNSSQLPEWKVLIKMIHDGSRRIQLRFPTLVGASYRIEVSSDLSTWQALTADILGDGNLKTQEVIRGGATQQFFRVKKN
jgi:hypothetical protein